MVAWPEIITTVVSGWRCLISASASRPSMPGIQISRKMRSGVSSASLVRASGAEPTAVTRYPSSSSTARSVAWMARSSSTIRMCSRGMLDLHRRRGASESARGRLDHEPASRGVFVLHPDAAAVLGDDLVHDGEAQPHAGGLGGEVGDEEPLLVLRADAGTAVRDHHAGARRLVH